MDKECVSNCDAYYNCCDCGVDDLGFGGVDAAIVGVVMLVRSV